MTIESGTRIGVYEVAEVIGTGGMGEVYRASDSNLERDVAIKFLPPSFAADPGRIARFEQEAKVLAALNHPNIAHVYGLERSGDKVAIAMELVDGPTLADRIAQGPIPVDEALAIAMQIAAALEAAHDKGIVHRDLKPANVKLRKDGHVKVLDFGIAKAFDPASLISGPQSPVMTTPVTQAGVILGTAAYMSPEQARGRQVDQRTDIWAFGCVLFEMLTGQPVFAGEDVSITLARVLERDTNLDSMPRAIAPGVRQAIALCLRKDPKKRLHSIGDVRLALEGELAAAEGATTQAAGRAAAPWWSRALPVGAALILGGGIVGAWSWMLAGDETPKTITRFSEAMLPLNNLPGIAISDDGMQIAYTEGSPPQTMIRRVDEFVARPFPEATTGVAGSNNLTTMLCFSPDGEWLVHASLGGRQLRKSPLSGGRGLALAELSSPVIGGCDWAEDGFIYLGMEIGLARIAESGGELEVLITTDNRTSPFASPQVLPGGGRVLYTVLQGDVLGEMRTEILDLVTGEAEVVLPTGGLTIFAPTGPEPGAGYLAFGQDSALFAAPYDLGSREVGSVRPVVDRIYGIAGLSFTAISQTGTLAYIDGLLISGSSSLNWVDRNGGIDSGFETPRLWGEVTLSPDGTRAAGGMVDLSAEVAADIYTLDLASERLARTTFARFNGSVVWAPDGERMLYASFDNVTQSVGTIESVPVDNSAQPTTIARFERFAVYPTSISPDGRVLIGTAQGSTTVGADIVALALDGINSGGEPSADDDLQFLVQTNFATAHAVFSPDGRWIAYESDESGANQVYVVPYPGPGGKNQISTDGGWQPQWSPVGDQIFYVSGTRMMAVDVQTEPGFRAGSPRQLFESATLLQDGPTNAPAFQYAVAPDGERFLMLSTGGGGGDQQLRVVENWFEELKNGSRR